MPLEKGGRGALGCLIERDVAVERRAPYKEKKNTKLCTSKRDREEVEF